MVLTGKPPEYYSPSGTNASNFIDSSHPEARPFVPLGFETVFRMMKVSFVVRWISLGLKDKRKKTRHGYEVATYAETNDLTKALQNYSICMYFC